MRLRWALLAGLATVSLVGCLHESPTPSAAWWSRLSPFHGPTGPDVVQMDVAVLECPVGDSFINGALWELADEQVVGLEHKAVLDDNGFRVGELGGITPPGLLLLLRNERNNPSPRRVQLHAGNPTPITLGARLPACEFDLRQDGKPVKVSLKDAECGLQVVPTLAADGAIHLHVTPRITHGERRLWPAVSPDRRSLLLPAQRATEDYERLGWDVTVAPGQYVVVGTRYDRPGTLGHRCFLRPAEAQPVQRLLVICTSRMGQGWATEPVAETAEDAISLSRAPPVALQASWTGVVRGSGGE
jgi:hypothetical protein